MEIASKYNPVEVEGKWYQYWLDNGFFKSKPDGREPYTIVIPPPNVTGVLHMGHMLNNTIQDILIRRARMQGKNACWVPGTDHASIATEAKVVNRLAQQGIKKTDLTREDFLKHAWEWKEEHGGIILKQLRKLGASCDWDRTAFTMDELRSESVIKVFVDLYNKGLIYRGVRMVNWDPKALTALSDEEVIYKEEHSKLYYLRYKVEGDPEGRYAIVATTRPETIMGDTAMCINPNDPKNTWLKGKKVIVPLVNRVIPVIEDDYVDIEFGTGCLKVTPAHDVNDYMLGVLMLLNAFAMLAGSGGAPRAAIYMGKKDNATAEKIVGNCFTFLVICAVVLTAGFYGTLPVLLKWFGASSVTMPYALSYARIYVLGSIFVLIVLGMNLFITTQGFAKISMMTTVIGAVINIILDPIFIFVFNMGVQGAALATVLSQAVGAVWILHFLTGDKTILRLRKSNLKLKSNIIMPCLALGISSFVMLSTESILSVSFTSSLSRYGGDLAVGAMTIITSTNQLVLMPLQGICQGGQPIMSYNYGAKNYDRVKKAFFTQFKVCVLFTIVSWVVMMLVPQVFAGMFTSNADLRQYTVWTLRVYMAGIFALGFQICCQQSFMALGQAKVSLIMACLRKLILLIPLIFIFPVFMSNKVLVVFLAEPVSDIIAAVVTTSVFMVKFKKLLVEDNS